MNKRNQRDNRDSLEMGNSAQAQFQAVAEARGWTVKSSSGNSDINEHWGFQLDKEGMPQRLVDVKSRKRISRLDANPQDDWQWIELHGVRKHDSGWLFNGKSDWIAFETADSFLIVDRKKIIQLVEQNVDMSSLVKQAAEAKYRVYSREGRPDLLTLIETSKLKEIAEDIWAK